MKALMTALLVATFSFGVAVEDAEAKRFGGGKSFGSKKMFSAPFNRSAPKKAQEAPGKAAPAAGTAAAGGAAAAGAGKAGMMGMLGGLAMGGLLGALFFGGAFENINFLDILIFGLIAFVLFKLLAGRRRSMEPQPAGGVPMDESGWQQQPQTANVQQRQAVNNDRGFDTDIMFKDKAATDAPKTTPEGYMAPEYVQLPADFDKAAFIGGAQNAFTMLQKAWDDGEMAEIRGLTTDKVFGEIQDQYFDREGENRTEILEATAEIIDYSETDSDKQVAVLFNVNMREIDVASGADAEAQWVQEVWHFVQPKNSFAPTWFLDGLQQVED